MNKQKSPNKANSKRQLKQNNSQQNQKEQKAQKIKSISDINAQNFQNNIKKNEIQEDYRNNKSHLSALTLSDSGTVSMSNFMHPSQRSLSYEDLSQNVRQMKEQKNKQQPKQQRVSLSQTQKPQQNLFTFQDEKFENSSKINLEFLNSYQKIEQDQQIQQNLHDNKDLAQLMNVVMDLKNEVKFIKKEFESTENLNGSLKNRLDSHNNQMLEMKYLISSKFQQEQIENLKTEKKDLSQKLDEQYQQFLQQFKIKDEEINQQNIQIKELKKENQILKKQFDNEKYSSNRNSQRLAMSVGVGLRTKKNSNIQDSCKLLKQSDNTDQKCVDRMEYQAHKVENTNQKKPPNFSLKQSPVTTKRIQSPKYKSKLKLAYQIINKDQQIEQQFINKQEKQENILQQIKKKQIQHCLLDTSSFIKDCRDKSPINGMDIDCISISPIKNKSSRQDKSILCDKSSLQAILLDSNLGIISQIPLKNIKDTQEQLQTEDNHILNICNEKQKNKKKLSFKKNVFSMSNGSVFEKQISLHTSDVKKNTCFLGIQKIRKEKNKQCKNLTVSENTQQRSNKNQSSFNKTKNFQKNFSQDSQKNTKNEFIQSNNGAKMQINDLYNPKVNEIYTPKVQNNNNQILQTKIQKLQRTQPCQTNLQGQEIDYNLQKEYLDQKQKRKRNKTGIEKLETKCNIDRLRSQNSQNSENLPFNSQIVNKKKDNKILQEKNDTSHKITQKIYINSNNNKGYEFVHSKLKDSIQIQQLMNYKKSFLRQDKENNFNISNNLFFLQSKIWNDSSSEFVIDKSHNNYFNEKINIANIN